MGWFCVYLLQKLVLATRLLVVGVVLLHQRRKWLGQLAEEVAASDPGIL